jgi:hypothetical protein
LSDFFPRIIRSFPLLACIVCLCFAAESDSVTIPKDGTLGGRPVKSGVYRVEIDESADKPYLRLIQKEKIVATELAIVLPARGSGKTSARITKLKGKEFVRIQARFRNKWYFVYVECKP